MAKEIRTYSEKLRDPRWQRKRLEVLQRDDFSCKFCSDAHTELHIHHLKYSGDPWEARMEDLITCCKDCHSTIELIKVEFPEIQYTPVRSRKRFQEAEVRYVWQIVFVLKAIDNNHAFVIYDYLDGMPKLIFACPFVNLKDLLVEFDNYLK